MKTIVGNFKIHTLPVGQLQTNCYLIFDCENQEGLIIDPGDDADYIMRIIADCGIKPLKILATHGHFDHLLAATELALAYDIPFLIHRRDKFLVRNLKRSAEYFLKIKQVDPPPPINDFLKDGLKISFGAYQLEVLETPGHTPGSVSLYLRENSLLLCGDTVFKQGVGRTDFLYSSFWDLKKSLRKISDLPGKTVLYPGHGPKTDIAARFKAKI